MNGAGVARDGSGDKRSADRYIRRDMSAPRPEKLNPVAKTVLEMGPLAVFFLSYRFGDDILGVAAVRELLLGVTGPAALAGDSGPLYVATAAFMVAIGAALPASWALTGHVPRMAVLPAVVVAVFGGLTLWLQDATFIKMKPTIVNALFGLILAAGLMQGRSYLKYLMGEALPLDDLGWTIFTRRWVVFFAFMAALNELVWRTQTTEFWVTFKTFSGVPLTLLFLGSQVPLLQRHMQKSGSD